MRADHRNLSWTLIPMFLASILCKAQKVENQQICAVKGSSVVIPCSFNAADIQSIAGVQWGHENSKRAVAASSSRKTSRFQYIGDRRSNCSMQIDQVKKSDAGKYSVRIFVSERKSFELTKWRSILKVVDEKISVTKPKRNRTTKEGDSVNLTCISACDGNDSSSVFTWFKDGELLHEGSVLHLNNVSTTSSGNYTCSLKTQPRTSSRVIHIDVKYAPKNTSVSVKPSMEVYVGGSFTLTCSSQANPPVQNYTWFKKDHNQGDHVVGHQSAIFSSEGGKYFCSTTNKYGSQNSSVLSLKTKAPWATFTRNVLIIATVAVLLIVTAVITVTRLYRKKISRQKTDFDDGLQDTEYVNWLSCDNHQTQGESHPEEEAEVVYVTVDCSNRRTNMRQQMDTLETDKNVIYSTVCRNQQLNPSYVEPS